RGCLPHLPEGRGLDGARRRAPHPLSADLLSLDACALRSDGAFGASAVPDLELPAVPAGIGAVPSHRGHAASLRLQPARDAQPLSSRIELHRLLAADKHLLEGLHAEGLLLSRRL